MEACLCNGRGIEKNDRMVSGLLQKQDIGIGGNNLWRESDEKWILYYSDEIAFISGDRVI